MDAQRSAHVRSSYLGKKIARHSEAKTAGLSAYYYLDKSKNTVFFETQATLHALAFIVLGRKLNLPEGVLLAEEPGIRKKIMPTQDIAAEAGVAFLLC